MLCGLSIGGLYVSIASLEKITSNSLDFENYKPLEKKTMEF